jgi:APA family basic amino acid/polyamine antiporter
VIFLLKLKRDVGPVGATAYILGVIIGAGIYVIIGKAAGLSGNSLWLSFLVAGFIAACTGLSYAELSSTFPFDSAEYLYTERAFRDRRFAFGIGWLKVFTLIIACAAVALGFGGYLSALTGWNIVFCALLLLFVLTLINLIGVKQAVEFDIVMVAVAVVGLLAVIAIGIPHLHNPGFYLESPTGLAGVFTGAALIFFAFLGFENIGSISQEVRRPRKTLPLALIISIIVSTVLYILVAIIAISVVPWNELAQSASPLSDVVTSIMGGKAGMIMAVMALAATGSTVLGLLIGTSRMIYGLAEERSLPRVFLRLSRKRRAPYVAILVFAAICALFIIPGNITSIAFLTDFGALFIFMIVNLALIVLRYTYPNLDRGFKVPLNIGRFPVIPAIGLVSCAALLFSFEKKMLFSGILIFLIGLVLYSVFAERSARKELAKAAENRKIVGIMHEQLVKKAKQAKPGPKTNVPRKARKTSRPAIKPRKQRLKKPRPGPRKPSAAKKK